jgi:hypothetical protein
MQSRVFLPALAAAALFAAPAFAAPYAVAKLATPLPAAKTQVLGGLQWSCEADACVATPKGQAATWSTNYACKKVSATFGALASYSSRGMTLSAGDLSACNKGAATAATPTATHTAAQ